MNKIISTKKISATFLAIVLIAGTIAMISPSFITNAHAIAMDNNNFKKSFGKDVSIKYVKCNNINVNVNGFELDIGAFPDLLGSEVAAAETGANSFGSNGGSNNGPSGSNSGFVFVCINNNNNAGQGEGGEEINQCAEDVEACFEEFLGEGQFPTFVAELQVGVTAEINGESVTLRSFADICEALEGLTYEQLQNAVFEIVNAVLAPPGGVIKINIELVNCIAEALDIEIPVGIPR